MSDVERAHAADHGAIIALLDACDLPPDGLEQDNLTLLVVRDGDGLVGCAALEWYGHGVLLRSVAVRPGQRGAGLGRLLVTDALSVARDCAATDAFLLTTDASDYFSRFGFRAVTREQVRALAPELATSVQFTTACPAGAQAMHRPLASEAAQSA